VCLTIDVETYSGDYERDVYGYGLGLPSSLTRAGAMALPPRSLLRRSAHALGYDRRPKDLCGPELGGADIQLHIHPVVAKVEGVQDRYDVLWMHDRPTQERLIELGRRILLDCTGTRRGFQGRRLCRNRTR